MMNLLTLYRSNLRRYATVTGAVMLGVLVFTFIMPHVYSSKATIMPPERKEGSGGIASLLSSSSSPLSMGLSATENKSALVFAEILKSRSLMKEIIDTLKLMQHPLFEGMTEQELRTGLSKLITIDTKKAGMITVEVDVATGWFPFGGKTDLAAHAAADIAMAACGALDHINLEKALDHARKTKAYIERVIDLNRREMDTLQQRLETFQNKNKVIALDAQVEAIVQNAVAVGTELAKAEVELTLAQQELHASSPEVQMLKRKVTSLQEQYQRVQKGGIMNADGFSIPLDQMPELTREYTNIIRDLKIKEQVNVYLQTQRMEQLLNEARDLPTVVPLDFAEVPEKRTSPARVLMLVITWILMTVGFALYLPGRAAWDARRSVSA